MIIKWVQQVTITIHTENKPIETKYFQGERCVEELMEYLCEQGFYSTVTLETKISTPDIVMKRLKE